MGTQASIEDNLFDITDNSIILSAIRFANDKKPIEDIRCLSLTDIPVILDRIADMIETEMMLRENNSIPWVKVGFAVEFAKQISAWAGCFGYDREATITITTV